MEGKTNSHNIRQVANLKNNDQSIQNKLFVSHQDPLLSITKHIKYNNIVFLLGEDKSLNPDQISVSRIHRSLMKVSINDKIAVEPFDSSQCFNLSRLSFSIENAQGNYKHSVKENDMGTRLKNDTNFVQNVFTTSMSFLIEMEGIYYKLIVSQMEGFKDTENVSSRVEYGVLFTNSIIHINSENQIINVIPDENITRPPLWHPNFQFEDMGIGGLDTEFQKIFRRAFASRTFPTAVIKKLGINHVKGMLLYGPPGTGKTLIARQIGKMLCGGREPKKVNGPEILNKYVGQSEENIRNLFAEAEQEYKEKGDNSGLHIIIFDEIDAICKQRGTVSGASGVHDTVVNQLLSKIDGVDSLNNILVIGMTNRKDLLDEALLRAGRLELHLEIGLPDAEGRSEILKIHTRRMRENNMLDASVDLTKLVPLTKNFSGAEIETLVKTAASFALGSKIDIKNDNITPSSFEIKVTMEHFFEALKEVKPAYGVKEDDLHNLINGELIQYGFNFEMMYNVAQHIINMDSSNSSSPLTSILLEGQPGSGKTALSAHLSLNSGIPFVKVISADMMIGMGELSKCGIIHKIFTDAYKSTSALIILDDLERLVEYVRIGPRFSNTVLQCILVLLKKPPVQGRKLMIISTTSNLHVINELEFSNCFNMVLHVPSISNKDEVEKVFDALSAPINNNELQRILAKDWSLNPIGIKQLLFVIENSVNNGIITYESFEESLVKTGSFNFS